MLVVDRMGALCEPMRVYGFKGCESCVCMILRVVSHSTTAAAAAAAAAAIPTD